METKEGQGKEKVAKGKEKQEEEKEVEELDRYKTKFLFKWRSERRQKPALRTNYFN